MIAEKAQIDHSNKTTDQPCFEDAPLAVTVDTGGAINETNESNNSRTF